MDWLIWLIIFIVLWTILLLAVWSVYCNLRMARIAPGTFQSVVIKVEPNKVESHPSLAKEHRWKWHFMKLTLAPEKIQVDTQPFFADSSMMGGASSPQVRIGRSDPARHNYYRLGGRTLSQLKRALNGTIKKSDVSAALQSATRLVKLDEELQADKPVQINSGQAFMIRVTTGNSETLFLWFYTGA